MIPLFRCQWVKLTGAGVKVDKLYGMTTVYLNNLGYREEPFVLAKDVAQVFYVKDMSTKPGNRKDKTTSTSCDEPKRHIVLSGKKTSWGWRTRQTCQKIITSLMKFRPSQ